MMLMGSQGMLYMLYSLIGLVRVNSPLAGGVVMFGGGFVK